MRLSATLARAGAVLLLGCGGGDTTPNPPPPPPPPPPPAPVASVTLNRDTASVIPSGTFQLTATPRDANGNALTGRTVTWQSGTPAAATVDGNGLVTGVAVGTSQVTATSEGQSKAAAIAVKDGAVVGAAGATVNGNGGNASVVIPAGALAANTTLTISPNAAPPGSNPRLLTGTAYDLGPDGVAFAQPATIQLKYNDAAATGHDQSLLRVHKYNGTTWVPLAGSTVDVPNKTVSGNTSSFSQYSVLELVPVFGLDVTPLTATLFVGGTGQITAVVKDASGAVALGYTPTFASSDEAVATVNATGLVTAVGFGSATITASAGGKSAGTALSVITTSNIPTFTSKPFTGDFANGNFLDHDIPKEFVDVNGVFTPFWGEVHANTGGMTDGHSGYDWALPVGTPLLAMAPGKVFRVDESSQPFFCPPLNQEVSNQKSVFIDHILPGGTKIRAWYVHNSQNLVTVGQDVVAGQQVALSGNTGCSTGAHLHLEVFRVVEGQPLRTLDPYGWTGNGTDPWSAHPDGTASIQLWKPGVAPRLYREFVNNFNNAAACCIAVIQRVVVEGPDDAANLNNEYIEIAIDLRVGASVSLNNYKIRGDVNALLYNIPNGIVLNAQRPFVRFYTGSGTNTATEFYMGRTQPAWSNLRNDCSRLVSPGGGQYRISLGASCPLEASAGGDFFKAAPPMFSETIWRPVGVVPNR